ncbi:Hypp8571 [Branchiostoma lanceolatum]|uniref:Hypp8571 protein n=1 Tax=Branchiostoma lanceolatum TaxID=7740 RepID=A0A8J9Z922_BRALA|nr:Hypp8571 [Branchiostoma lanceolatum]
MYSTQQNTNFSSDHQLKAKQTKMSSIRSDVSVLVPFSNGDKDKTEALRRCPTVQVSEVVFSNIEEKETLLDYVQRVKKLVADHNINIILPTIDLSTFVHAAIARDFPHIPGPSVESCYLAFHKAYTRQYLDPMENLMSFDVVDLDSPTMLEDAERALEKVGLPAFVKPAAAFDTFGVAKVENYEDMKRALQNLRTMRDEHPDFESSPSAAFFKDYFKQYLDVEKYPLALRDVVIVEPYLDAVALYTVDGCVVDKEIVRWTITDELRFDHQEAKFMTVISPTSEPEDLQKRIWDVYEGVMARMVQFGFNNCFTNIEVFRMKDGQLRLCEVNARGSKQLQGCYTESYKNANQDYVYLTAGRGIKYVTPPETGRWASAYIVKFDDLERPGNLMDFDQIEKLKSDPDVYFILTAGPDDDVTNFTGSAGSHFCWLFTYGDSREAMIRKLVDVLKLVVKKPERLTYPVHYGM